MIELTEKVNKRKRKTMWREGDCRCPYCNTDHADSLEGDEVDFECSVCGHHLFVKRRTKTITEYLILS